MHPSVRPFHHTPHRHAQQQMRRLQPLLLLLSAGVAHCAPAPPSFRCPRSHAGLRLNASRPHRITLPACTPGGSGGAAVWSCCGRSQGAGLDALRASCMEAAVDLGEEGATVCCSALLSLRCAACDVASQLGLREGVDAALCDSVLDACGAVWWQTDDVGMDARPCSASGLQCSPLAQIFATGSEMCAASGLTVAPAEALWPYRGIHEALPTGLDEALRAQRAEHAKAEAQADVAASAAKAAAALSSWLPSGGGVYRVCLWLLRAAGGLLAVAALAAVGRVVYATMCAPRRSAGGSSAQTPAMPTLSSASLLSTEDMRERRLLAIHQYQQLQPPQPPQGPKTD